MAKTERKLRRETKYKMLVKIKEKKLPQRNEEEGCKMKRKGR